MLASREKGSLPWPGHGPPAETRRLYGAEVIAVAQGESGAEIVVEVSMGQVT